MIATTGSTAKAENALVVVELFTSQGCSSCPPADELLGRLGQRDNVIALALHVDYWDYIGWKDQFAHAAFTGRQKGYARSFGSRAIYTPQMVINGSKAVVGNRVIDVADMVQDYAQKGMLVPLDLSLEGSTLRIAAPAQQDMQNADLVLIRYMPHQTVSIPRGENAGKDITYTHIVTEWHDIGDWNGRTALSESVAVEGSAPIVVLVQAKDHGPILAAARLR
ncbi:DUF1223 domain-containing protein [Marivita sp. S0852]|uniref:DUF1223 domain-containing protein n=1 Tax=Marivita sp. S0852 TaxID=3373893 RepID=UPI0039826ACC